MVTLLADKEFVITHQEMIKGIAKGWGPNATYLSYHDTLVVPIIDNTAQERDLKDSMVYFSFLSSPSLAPSPP
jgi:methylthioribulose-1-phosphate dehydratase